mgnify:CR=1 FL=1
MLFDVGLYFRLQSKVEKVNETKEELKLKSMSRHKNKGRGTRNKGNSSVARRNPKLMNLKKPMTGVKRTSTRINEVFFSTYFYNEEYQKKEKDIP